MSASEAPLPGATVAATAAPHQRAASAEHLGLGVVVLALAMLMGMQPVATDLYLPALPSLATDLQAAMGTMQATLYALLVSFGLVQLVAGPVSDRFGRRPVLLAGLAVFTLGATAAAMSRSMPALILCRALQGAGVAAAVVCARAMVRDLFLPSQGARVMSATLTGVGLLALASPLVGGWLATHGGWRAALVANALFGAAGLALVALALPETAPRLNPRALQWRPLWANWRQVFAHRGFRAWALLTTASFAGLFAYLAGSSFLFISVLGVSRFGYGLFLAGTSLCYIAGTFLCRRWLLRHGMVGAVQRAAGLTLLGGAVLMPLANWAWPGPWALMLPMGMYAMAHGVHQPCGQAGVVAPFPAQAGAASALAGFALSAAGVGVGLWLGVALKHSVWPLVGTVAAFALCTSAAAWTLVRRHGQAGAGH